jgi:flagellum-specific peptidoglycan hydrolase FlgJ
MTNAEFIAQIGAAAAADMAKSGILASMTIAQAICESEWGKSGLTVKANALFGIKADASWKGKSVTMRTREVDQNGNDYYIDAPFRAYDSWADSISDHNRFLLENSRYAALIGELDYKSACRKIQAAGYATARNYAEKLVKLIEENGLEMPSVYKLSRALNDKCGFDIKGAADEETLMKAPGVDAKTARAIYEYFHRPEANDSDSL